MERPNDEVEQPPQSIDEAPTVADPIHHGDDDMPVPVGPEDTPLDDVIEPEPQEDLSRW